jgi:hypothetical protein
MYTSLSLQNLFNDQEIATIEQGEQVTLDPTSDRGIFVLVVVFVFVFVLFLLV